MEETPLGFQLSVIGYISQNLPRGCSELFVARGKETSC